MLAYILRRLALIVPTLLGIMVINFLVVQLAPGGPIEHIAAQLEGTDVGATARFSGGGGETMQQGGGAGAQGSSGAGYRGRQGLDPAFVKELEKQFGFDKPWYTRFGLMMWNYAHFDFGKSYFRDRSVIDLLLDKMPVSISLGLWTTLIMYSVSIPLGIAKAVRDGSRFDIATSAVIVVGYAIPGFLFAVLLIVIFASGTYEICGSQPCFPLRGLGSDNWAELTPLQKAGDYLWHLVLPITAMVISSFASMTMLTKNSFLDEIGKQYVTTAYAKGLSQRRVLYGHVFRNAMLLIVAGFPAAFVGIFFTGSMLIEVIFSLDGMGLLGYEAVINRDYPIIFGTLFIFTLLGLVMKLVGDIAYMLVDPRIDFEARTA